MTSPRPAPPRHRQTPARLRIAVLGTGGVPADGSGSEIAVEEIGRRLVQQGHHLTVYGRGPRRSAPREHLGMRCVTLPAPTSRTFSGTALAAAHLVATRRHDVALVFGTVNAPLVPLIRGRGTAVAMHVGGLEWQRDGLGAWARRYHRLAERLAVREADALVADSHGVADYYDDEFGVPVEVAGVGTRILRNTPSDALEGLGLVPGRFHLVVARRGPEHRVDVVVEGYHRSTAALPLVVVGADAHTVADVAQRDPRIRLVGDIRDQRVLDQLFAHAAGYLHGHSTGGTSPSLLQAMGAGTSVIGWDVVFNREVVGTAGLYFTSPGELARHIEDVERYPMRFRDIGELMQERARKRYDWDSVAESYDALVAKLSRGYSTRDMSSGRRLESAWSATPVPAGTGHPGSAR